MNAEIRLTNETTTRRSTLAAATTDKVDSTKYVFLSTIESKDNQTNCLTFSIDKQQAELLVAYLKLTFGL